MELKTLGASFPEVLALGQAGTGFNIQQRYFGDRPPLCLVIGERITKPMTNERGGGERVRSRVGGNVNTREEIESEEMRYIDTVSEDQSYFLTWADCTQGTRWILRKADIVTSDNGLDVDQHSMYTVHPANNPDMCFDTIVNESNRTQVILTKCKKSFRALTKETQLMYLETYTDTSTPSYSIFSASKKNLQNQKSHQQILHTGTKETKSEALYMVKFLDPGDVITGSCSLSQLSTPHGRVGNENPLPFVLYGHQVVVRCDPGYGVRSLNYSGLQTVVCSHTSRALPCRRIGSKKKKSCKNRGGRAGGGGSGVLDLTLVVAIASSVIAAILAAVLAVTLKRRKRGVVMDHK